MTKQGTHNADIHFIKLKSTIKTMLKLIKYGAMTL